MRVTIFALLVLGAQALNMDLKLHSKNKDAPPASELVSKKPKRAFVTLLTKEDKDPSYVKAASVLVRGLLLRGTTDNAVIVAVTKNISEVTRCRLRSLCAEVREIEEV